MKKMDVVWAIATKPSSAAELCTAAATLGEKTALFYAGKREDAVGAHTVYYLGDGTSSSFLNYLPAIVQKAKEQSPDLVLIEVSRNGRAAASAVAAAVGTSAMTDLSSLAVEDTTIVGQRMVYGGAAFLKACTNKKTAVATISTGLFEAGTVNAVQETLDLTPTAEPVRFIERRKKEGHAFNIAASKRVVAAGRGIGRKENLDLISALAGAIEADVGCSRPIFEEEGWLPEEAFVGISGNVLKADIYVAVGISGQIQHMVGANQSRTIFAINKDESAPIFKQCDYGIVGRMEEIVPKLIDKFIK